MPSDGSKAPGAASLLTQAKLTKERIEHELVRLLRPRERGELIAGGAQVGCGELGLILRELLRCACSVARCAG